MSYPWHYWRLSNVLRKQTINIPKEEGGLKRVLTVWHLLGYGIANTIGAGIFVTSGVASLQAGSLLVASFAFAGFAALLSALCYAEYGARFPVAGSSYSFTYVSLGEALAWFVGWNMTLEYAVGASAVSAGWAGYFFSFLTTASPSLDIPNILVNGYYLWGDFTFSPMGVAAILLCTVILWFGVSESATFNLVISAVNMCIVIFVIILGAMNFSSLYWDNFFSMGISNHGFAGVMQAAATVFISFIGFDATTCLAGETKNPSFDLPVSVIGTLTITTTLYIGVSLVLCGMVNANTINTTAPLSQAFGDHGLHWAVLLVSVGSVTTLTANVLSSLIGQPRVFYQMALDGLLFSPFTWINQRGILTFGTFITATMAGVLALLYDLNSLADMISIGTLMAYSCVCAGVIVMRYTIPEDKKKCDIVHEIRYTHFAFTEKLGKIISENLLTLLFVYTVSTVFIGVSMRMGWGWEAAGSFIVVNAILLLFLLILKQKDVPDTFKCPLVPIVPLGGVTINLLLITTLPMPSIYRVLVWSALGILIYMFYGIKYSKLNVKTQEETTLITDIQ
eukprot:TRINITY_DN5514_c0_g1_i1.p1 TRINITY_DN5514_c0_g1~~TRINITY_DN5514_c0_g1_i1.p1  ORF type:complete len:564 (+),score=83.34 TRINITY_DN5514_c0_g1_i1:48-1739(+)